MELSEFTPLGLYDLSAEVPLARTIYDALKASFNAKGATNIAGDYHEARLRAWAIQFATAYRGARHVEAQIDPDTVLELLPAREAEYGIVVPMTATLADRRGTLAATMRLALGATYSNVRQALVDLLGADFVALRLTANSELVTAPADPATGPANFVLPNVPRRTYILLDGVSKSLGTAANRRYRTLPTREHPHGLVPPVDERFTVGEWVVVEPENPGMAERVQVTGETGIGFGDSFIRLSLNRPHEPGCLVATMPWPYWISTKRHTLIHVSPAAAAHPEVRRKIHSLMERLSRTVSTWSIVGSSGPFTLGSPTLGILGSTPFGAI
jgi:hypothetical protein